MVATESNIEEDADNTSALRIDFDFDTEAKNTYLQ
jgi:hypothetical protein